MPSIWLRHSNPKIIPFEVHYSEGQDAAAIAASYAEQGWSRFNPTDDTPPPKKATKAARTRKRTAPGRTTQLSELRELTAPGSPTSESSDSENKE